MPVTGSLVRVLAFRHRLFGATGILYAGGYPLQGRAAPVRHRVGLPQRDTVQEPRCQRLTRRQRESIHLLARSQLLRSLAADFGVSHEKFRGVLRGMPPGNA